MAVGPLRVSAGVIRLRPVRMRDGVHWSRIRLASARRGCCAVTLRLTGHGETIC